MKKIIFLFMIISLEVFSQADYLVYFTDKKGVKFNPYEYFDQKAIQRRLQLRLNLYDTTDFPVKKEYIDKVDKITPVNGLTRWLNGVFVRANDIQIAQISKLKFVKRVQKLEPEEPKICGQAEFIPSELDTELLNMVMESFGAEYFEEHNITGKGIRIAIFDVGFRGADTMQVFEHIRKQHRILKTYDFIKKRDFVYDYGNHGTNTFSCIAGVYHGYKLGMAPDAEFLLARTEYNTREPLAEEKYWLQAAEWADKNGADIISSSLGYTKKRYFQFEMDGETSIVAKAAKMASDKGILVVNAMGNDGNNKWKVVGTPADVEEVLSVGGTDPFACNTHIAFSSYGPTADLRLKPEVAAPAYDVVASYNGIEEAYGTSFATPLVSGFAACVAQLTGKKGQALKQEVIKSADLYPYFDYAVGYGIPQAEKLFDKPKQTEPTFIIASISDVSITISLLDTTDIQNFYYKFTDIDGQIINDMDFNLPPKPIIIDYGVLRQYDDKTFTIEFPVPTPQKLEFSAYYKGYILEKQVK